MPYLLDTVTISAFRRNGRTPPEVLRWSASLDVPCHYLSVISLNEIRFGIRTVEAKDPDFAQELHAWYQAIVEEGRFYRILPDFSMQVSSSGFDQSCHRSNHFFFTAELNR